MGSISFALYIFSPASSVGLKSPQSPFLAFECYYQRGISSLLYGTVAIQAYSGMVPGLLGNSRGSYWAGVPATQ